MAAGQDLDGFEQTAAGLRELETWVPAATRRLGLGSLGQAGVRLDLGSFEQAAAGLRKLETWAATARQGLSSLGQVAGLRKVEVWAAVMRAVVMMEAMARAMVVREAWWWHGARAEDLWVD